MNTFMVASGGRRLGSTESFSVALHSRIPACHHIAICVALTLCAIAPPALAQSTPSTTALQVHVASPPPDAEDASALAAKLQNPVGDLINVPFQSNTNFNVGPNRG